MKQKKLFALSLLAAGALFAASCKDDSSWKPTWAVPLISEKIMPVGDFVSEDQVADFNQKIKTIWNNYVIEEMLPANGGATVVDATALAIFTDTTYGYVGADGNLNQATIDSLLNRGTSQGKIDSINSFLSGSGAVSGDSAMNYLLEGIVGNSTDVFVTAANVMEHLEGTAVGIAFADSIDVQMDSILSALKMDDYIDVNLSDLTQGAKVTRLELDMSMENTLPFDIFLTVAFVKSDSSGVLPRPLCNETLSTNQKLSLHENFNDGIDETKFVQLKVDPKKEEKLAPAALRMLAQQGIIIRGLRVKVAADMGSIINRNEEK